MTEESTRAVSLIKGMVFWTALVIAAGACELMTENKGALVIALVCLAVMAFITGKGKG